MKITDWSMTLWILALCLIWNSCGKDDPVGVVPSEESPMEIPPIPDDLSGPYRIEGASLLFNDTPTTFKGVNTLQTYGLGDPDLMNEWQIAIIREFIGNLREQPISGEPILASDNVWYHPLQTIVDQNRANNKITILCPFGWVNENGERTLFTGLNPTEQSFFEAYKIKMKAIAQHFKDQPDVWVEVWNEPFHWNNENGYSHDLWLADMKEMVDNLRWVDGFQNIIVVPGNEQGQSEEAMLLQGENLLQDRYNLLFDLHAYEKWLLDSNEQQITARLANIKANDLAFIMGEVGVQNVGAVMPVVPFLNAAIAEDITVLAWLWNQNSEDKNALLTDDGEPHATSDNNFWGKEFQDFLKR